MTQKINAKLSISSKSFGKTPEGISAELFTLTNSNGLIVKITNFGGVITEIHTPDKNGVFTDVNLGFDHIEPYYKDSPFFGALIGRFGNRIAKGTFTLDGKRITLDANNGKNHLHGGFAGFDKVLWNASSFETDKSVGLTLKYLSVDGDQGYPGNLQVTVVYELTNDNEILVKYHAVTDKATPVNLTQHAYFNLAGKGDVLNHEILINADRFTAIDAEAIPTGDLPLVENTPFDFRSPHPIGERINDEHEQIKNGIGYDHNFVLNKSGTKEYSLAARVYEPISGRVLEVFTTEPGVQFYSGNYLNGSLSGKGWNYTHRSGFCLEPQHFPDSPNQPQFPNTILRPGEEYTSSMSYKFSVVK
ncbi:MAG: galactose mutarotase [Gammaproteobacteria bacterium]|nr:MAG: galactose mutarotase [Gammaproteobacteria bacterium]